MNQLGQRHSFLDNNVYKHTSACQYTHMHTKTHTLTLICTHEQIHISIYIYIYIYKCVCVYFNTFINLFHAYILISAIPLSVTLHQFLFFCPSDSLCLFLPQSLSVYIHIYIYVCVCVCILGGLFCVRILDFF